MLQILAYLYFCYILAIQQCSSLFSSVLALSRINTPLIVAQGTYGRIPSRSLTRRVVSVFLILLPLLAGSPLIDLGSFNHIIIISRAARNRLENSLRINSLGTIVMPCERCSRLKLECRLLAGFRKYSNCTRFGGSCNASADNLGTLARIDRKKERLKKEIENSEILL